MPSGLGWLPDDSLLVVSMHRRQILRVVGQDASCDDDPDNEYPACHVHQQDWGVPVRVAPGGAARLPLVLAGLDEA